MQSIRPMFGGDSTVPDPIDPQHCTIIFHCDAHGSHCTSERVCSMSQMVQSRPMLGASSSWTVQACHTYALSAIALGGETLAGLFVAPTWTNLQLGLIDPNTSVQALTVQYMGDAAFTISSDPGNALSGLGPAYDGLLTVTDFGDLGAVAGCIKLPTLPIGSTQTQSYVLNPGATFSARFAATSKTFLLGSFLPNITGLSTVKNPDGTLTMTGKYTGSVAQTVVYPQTKTVTTSGTVTLPISGSVTLLSIGPSTATGGVQSTGGTTQGQTAAPGSAGKKVAVVGGVTAGAGVLGTAAYGALAKGSWRWGFRWLGL